MPLSHAFPVRAMILNVNFPPFSPILPEEVLRPLLPHLLVVAAVVAVEDHADLVTTELFMD